MMWVRVIETEAMPICVGASVRYNDSFHRVADPLRHLIDGLRSLPNPIGSPIDKLNVGIFRTRTLLSSFADIMAKDETTTEERLRVRGSEVLDICMFSLEG